MKGNEMSDDILDMNPNQVESIRNIPDGRYLGVIASYDIDKNANGNQFVQFAFRAVEPLEDQDMTGVELNRKIYSERQFLTKDAAKYTKQKIANTGVPEGATMRDWIEACVGAEVEFTVTTKTNEESGKEYRNVTNWRPAKK
jgi:hypothetical protein